MVGSSLRDSARVGEVHRRRAKGLDKFEGSLSADCLWVLKACGEEFFMFASSQSYNVLENVCIFVG